MKKVHAFFTGKVQGVGFRWSTKKYAEGLNLDGWVRNLPDKRVELLVEGPSEQVDELIAALHRQFQIESVDLEELAYEGGMGHFAIASPGNT